jgi:hypothetical protein
MIKSTHILGEVPMVHKHVSLKCIVVLIVFAVGAFAQVSGSLTGTVKDPSGRAISGATVQVFVLGGKEPVLSGTTNEVGLFHFSVVRPTLMTLSLVPRDLKKSRLQRFASLHFRNIPLAI